MPEVQPTNNPVPSDHPADARDNFKILDEFVNSRGVLTSPSRTGRQILTLTRYNDLVQPNIDGAEAAAVSATASAAAAEAAVSGLDYQGLWPDSGGSANKGDTYQTQVSGTPTGRYFTALMNTTVDPTGDDVNWRIVTSLRSIGVVTNYQADSVSDMISGVAIGENVGLALGQRWAVDDYYGGSSPSSSGVLFFKVVAAGTGTADGGKYIDVPGGLFQFEQNIKFPVNIKSFGAKVDSNPTGSNNPTDDTDAVEAVRVFLGGDGVIYNPTGFCYVTKLTHSSGIRWLGDGQGYSHYLQAPGQTVPLLEDNGTAFNSWIVGLTFDCNGNTPTGGKAGIYLGYSGQQFGVVSGVRDILVRNCGSHGAMFNGNVTTYDTMEFQFCGGRGVIFDGEGSKIRNVYGSNCTEGTGLLRGSSNELISGHAETGSSIAAFEIGMNTVGNTIDGIKLTGIGSNIHDSCVLISPGASNYRVTDVRASVASTANIPNGLINDTSSSLRVLYGLNTSGVAFAVPAYSGGVRVQVDHKESTPPTIGTFRTGDWFISAVGIGGYPIGWVCIAGGVTSPERWSPMGTVVGAIVDIADRTLTESDMGRRFINDGATGTVTHQLPLARAGAAVHFSNEGPSFNYHLDPRSGQLIRGGGLSKFAILPPFASVSLQCFKTNVWTIVASHGDITFEP